MTIDISPWRGNRCCDFFGLALIGVSVSFSLSSVKAYVWIFHFIQHWNCHSKFFCYSISYVLHGTVCKDIHLHSFWQHIFYNAFLHKYCKWILLVQMITFHKYTKTICTLWLICTWLGWDCTRNTLTVVASACTLGEGIC